MKKILITGASGFLGWHLCRLFQPEWDTYGTYCSRAVTIPGVTLLPLDLTETQSIVDLFQTLQPDAVIHAAAMSSPNRCQEQSELSHQINVVASWIVAEQSAAAQIPCAFTSSELVFDGLNPPYREADPVCPVSLYGKQKADAEAGMLARYPNAVICRMPLMFGFVPYAQSFIQPWIEAIQAGRSLNLFTDEFRTPISGNTAAKGIKLALNHATGLLHLGGKERLSRYEFGCLLVEALGLSGATLNACRQADMPMPAPRPPDVSLDSSLAFSLGYHPGTVKEELEHAWLEADRS
jgi:dTDP-4-dehydrorhamnose reductase